MNEDVIHLRPVAVLIHGVQCVLLSSTEYIFKMSIIPPYREFVKHL